VYSAIPLQHTYISLQEFALDLLLLSKLHLNIINTFFWHVSVLMPILILYPFLYHLSFFHFYTIFIIFVTLWILFVPFYHNCNFVVCSLDLFAAQNSVNKYGSVGYPMCLITWVFIWSLMMTKIVVETCSYIDKQNKIVRWSAVLLTVVILII
jgi:hypothetical protein